MLEKILAASLSLSSPHGLVDKSPLYQPRNELRIPVQDGQPPETAMVHTGSSVCSTEEGVNKLGEQFAKQGDQLHLTPEMLQDIGRDCGNLRMRVNGTEQEGVVPIFITFHGRLFTAPDGHRSQALGGSRDPNATQPEFYFLMPLAPESPVSPPSAPPISLRDTV